MDESALFEVLSPWVGQSGFRRRVARLRPFLTVGLVRLFKQRVDQEKTRNADMALRVAQAGAVVASFLPADSEAMPLAWWAQGNAWYPLCAYARALECYERAQAWYGAQGRELEVAMLQINQVAVLQEWGELVRALALARTVRDFFDAAAPEIDPTLAATCLAILEMNVSSAYFQLGEMQAALAACTRGKVVLAAQGNVVESARMDINRAVILRDMGRLVEAESLLQQAQRTLLAQGQWQEGARAEMNLGILAYWRGEYHLALRRLEQARAQFAAIPNPIEIAVVDMYSALVYERLGLYDRVVQQMADTGRRFQTNKRMLRQRAQVLVGQAAAYQRLGNHPLASRFLTQARTLLVRQGAHERVLLLDLERVHLALEAGQRTRAERLLRQLEPRLVPETWPVAVARARLLRVRCMVQGNHPRLSEARRLCEEALAQGERLMVPEVMIAAHQLLGQLAEREGAWQAALDHYQAAIEMIEGMRARLRLDEFQAGFMDDKLTIYEAAVRLSEQMDPALTLWYLTLGSLAASEGGLPASLSPALMESNERALWDELEALRNTYWQRGKLEGWFGGPIGAATGRVHKEAQRKLEEQIAERAGRLQLRSTLLDTRVAGADPHRRVRVGATRLLHALQARLSSTEALVQFYVLNGNFKAALVMPEGVRLVTLGPVERVTHLQRSWHFGLSTAWMLAEPERRADLDAFAHRHLARFYQLLLAPLEPYLADRESLWLGLPPAWAALPMAAFWDGHHYLVQRFRLTHLSSPEALLMAATGEKTASPKSGTALVLGYSSGSQLPHAPQEAERVASVLHAHMKTILCCEAEATLATFRAFSQDSTLIHLASHAVSRLDNPFFSWVELADQPLTVSALYEMALPRAPLVILSACETGLGQARGGGLLGMSRGFLAAGASGLVVSRWKVEDKATAALMDTFYSALSLDAPLDAQAAAALQQSQCRAIEDGQHPFLWAPFLFVKG